MLNDQEICTKLLPWFGDFLNENLIEIEHPEDNAGTPHDERVELIARFNLSKLAFEHTRVGPYVEFERDHAVTAHAQTKLNELVSDVGENEFLKVGLPTTWERLLIGGQKQTFLESLAQQVSRMLPLLRMLDHSRKYSVQKNVVVNNIPVSLFHGFSSRFVGLHMILMSDSETLEACRAERFGRKIPSKIEKLEKWSKKGFQSVLVLEDRDISLSNETAVAEAAHSLISGIKMAPDFVFYIDAYVPTKMVALPIKTYEIWNWNFWSESGDQRWFDF